MPGMEIILKKAGFIGMGNMGYAILSRLITVLNKNEVIFTDVNRERCAQITDTTGVACAKDNMECAKSADFIVLAVKPQFLPDVLSELSSIKDSLGDKVIISIAAGVTRDEICGRLYGTAAKESDKFKIVRAMPNMPALIGEGMTGIAYDEELFDEEEKKFIDIFFSSYGKYEKVNENLMNVVTCVGGSSPAYVFMFIEALADSAVKYGMPRDMAYRFAARTVSGSAGLLMESGKHPGELKDVICSPGGTTIAGVAALEEYGFRNAIMKATDECYKKGNSLNGVGVKNHGKVGEN